MLIGVEILQYSVEANLELQSQMYYILNWCSGNNLHSLS